MEKNVGDMDSKLRLAVGAVLGAVSLVILAQSLNLVSGLVPLSAIYSPILGVISAALLATSYTRECPICEAAGVDTTE
jgi:hypothetical protein